MSQTLWTPDRDVPLDQEHRDIAVIDPREMLVIRSMHAIAQRHDIVLACNHCRQPFRGLNDGHAQTEAIFCGCRELRATVRHHVDLG